MREVNVRIALPLVLLCLAGCLVPIELPDGFGACQKDTDCKDIRLCVDGQCIGPAQLDLAQAPYHPDLAGVDLLWFQTGRHTDGSTVCGRHREPCCDSDPKCGDTDGFPTTCWQGKSERMCLGMGLLGQKCDQSGYPDGPHDFCWEGTCVNGMCMAASDGGGS